MVWSLGIARRLGASGRRYKLATTHRRLYALLDEEPSEARTSAAISAIRSLDSLYGGADDRFARLMQSAFYETLVDRSMTDEELDAQIAEVNDRMRDLAC
jgi:hypothetical protein